MNSKKQPRGGARLGAGRPEGPATTKETIKIENEIRHIVKPQIETGMWGPFINEAIRAYWQRPAVRRRFKKTPT